MGDYTRSEWRWDREGRGWFRVVDDNGSIRIELGPDVAGMTMADRVEMLLFVLGYVSGELNNTPLEKILGQLRDLPVQPVPPLHHG